MKFVKSTIAVVVMGSLIMVTAANAADIFVQDTTGAGTQGVFLHLQGQDESVKSYDLDDMASAKQLNGLTSSVTDINDDLNSTKAGALLINQKVDDNAAKTTQEIKAVNDYTAQVQAQSNAADTVQNNRLTTLENQPKPKDGVDGTNGKDGAKGDKGDSIKGDEGKDGANGANGANGKDGITTTITKVDTATQAKVASNSHAIADTARQSANVAKDLQDAKQFFNQQQTNSNAQFNSLKDQVENNQKEARSGAASAVAIASMPQVEVGQSLMFSAGVGSFKDEQALSVGASFHAGDRTVIKAGVSDSTNNDLAMGAGVGIGF